MKKFILLLSIIGIVLVAFISKRTSRSTISSYTDSVNPKEWKFGIALWTFHTFSFAESLEKADSAGLKYIEPNNFTKTGPELKDSLMMMLSPAGIQKVKAMIEKRGLICESIYIGGGGDV